MASGGCRLGTQSRKNDFIKITEKSFNNKKKCGVSYIDGRYSIEALKQLHGVMSEGSRGEGSGAPVYIP